MAKRDLNLPRRLRFQIVILDKLVENRGRDEVDHPLGVLSQLLARLFPFFLFFRFVFRTLVVVEQAHEVVVLVFFVVAVFVVEPLQHAKLPRQLDKKLSQLFQIYQAIPGLVHTQKGFSEILLVKLGFAQTFQDLEVHFSYFILAQLA